MMPCINAVSYRFYPGIEPICQLVRAAGFDSLELSRPHFYEKLPTTGTRKRFAAWAAQLGLGLHGFDCWVEVEPFTALDKTLAEFEKSIQFAVDLDLGMIISHDTWAHVNQQRSASECMRANLDLFRRVVDMTDAHGLRLVFEPHPDTLSMDNAWCIEFIDSLAEGHSQGSVGVLYDLCHYGVGQPDAYIQTIETLGKRIQHLHFSDGDRKTYALHLPLGDGELELDAATEALIRIGFDGTLTCDIFNYPMLEDGARRNLEPICEVARRLGLDSR